MISGTFHVNSQEWRYFSREKSIVHTAHLAQLPQGNPGDTVLIASTAPTQNQGSRGNHNPMPTPIGPYFQTNIFNVSNTSFIIDSYGCVNWQGTILAQKNMGISVGPLNGALAYVDMVPEESGFYVVHVEVSGDYHTFGYQGVGNDGKVTAQIAIGSTIVAQSSQKIFMNGPSWDAVHNYINSIPRAITECLLPASAFRGIGLNIGDTTQGARFAMWAFKVADYG